MRKQLAGECLWYLLALGGFSHVIKTWAWRLTMLGEARNVSFGRTLGLRLISEAIGQLGVIGMVGGEATRVSLLGSGVSVAGAISSVTLDRGLFILAGAVVTIAGIVSLLFVVSVSHTLYIYASVLVVALVCLLIAGAIAIQRKWPVLSGLAHSRRSHSLVPDLAAKQGIDGKSLGAADHRVLP